MNNLYFEYNEDQVFIYALQEKSGRFANIWKPSKPRPSIDIDEWANESAARCDGLAALREFGDSHPNTVHFESDRIITNHAAVAALTAGQAHALRLPNQAPYVLTTRTTGAIGDKAFKLHATWTDGAQSITSIRKGAFLKVAQGEFLIPEPQYSLIELADKFDADATGLPSHWDALARFRQLLGQEHENANPIEMSEFLNGLRIYTGTALSLMLKGRKEDFNFDPILFDPETIKNIDEKGQTVSEGHGLLPVHLLERFQSDPRTGFKAFESAKRSYLLDPHTFLIVDRDLYKALQLVRKKQEAGTDERRAFAANPRAAIADHISSLTNSSPAETPEDVDDEEIASKVENLFIETSEYVDRAVGIGLWKPPALDFWPPNPNNWLPENFSIELDGKWVQLTPETITTLRSEIDTAITEGFSYVDFQGEQIPATPEVQEKLRATIGTEVPKPNPTESGSSSDAGTEPPDPTVVIVHENFVEENWTPTICERKIQPAEIKVPVSVKTQLLQHQTEALEWQIKGWCCGHHGLLNADDQGLGKTLQTLAFIAWLQNQKTFCAEHQTVLIVAPKGLLHTWKFEEQQHLDDSVLGNPIEVYGRGLDELRNLGCNGFDTDDGIAHLDLESEISKQQEQKRWVLTTYETLANYQHSFRKIRFPLVVFDEIQKIKNVKTLISLAVRSVNADFRIGLTGTPLENHMGELWTVVDAIAPGRLGTLRCFMDSYGDADHTKLNELHSRLFKPIKNSDGRSLPAVGQRRMKNSDINHLPRKIYRVYPVKMPDCQSHAYENAWDYLIRGNTRPTLKILHHIRGVSLHPEHPDTAQNDLQGYVERSARFHSLRQILWRIHSQKERALIFTEDRRMQSFIAQWIRSEFGVKQVCVINGATTIARRKEYVEMFQQNLKQEDGFDVLILSPRAAGVGLTLTAATHVVHLSRWWNPAVEEQCNDRIYRIGQERDVTIHLPLAIHPKYREQSFDCVLNGLMQRKRSLARSILMPTSPTEDDSAAIVGGMIGVSFNPKKIDQLNWEEFENWVIDQAHKSGDWTTDRTPQSGDGGVDVILKHISRTRTQVLVQAKHTTKPKKRIGTKAVSDLLRAQHRYHIDRPLLVAITNALEFTDRARNLASRHDVLLVDRDKLGLWPNHILA